MKEWQLGWQNETSNLHEFKKSIHPWPKSVSLKRNEEVKINWLRIGHTLLTYKRLLKNNEEPIFKVCNTTTTVKHILTECQNFKETRINNNNNRSLAVSLGPDKKEQKKTLSNFYTKQDCIYKIVEI